MKVSYSLTSAILLTTRGTWQWEGGIVIINRSSSFALIEREREEGREGGRKGGREGRRKGGREGGRG